MQRSRGNTGRDGPTGRGRAAGGAGESRRRRVQRQVEAHNQQLAALNARDAVERGEQRERAQRERTARLAGEQHAAQAANMVDTTFGSALAVATRTAMEGELEALNIRSNAHREAYGYKLDGVNAANRAAQQRAAGENARTASVLQAGGPCLPGPSTATSSTSDTRPSPRTGSRGTRSVLSRQRPQPRASGARQSRFKGRSRRLRRWHGQRHRTAWPDARESVAAMERVKALQDRAVVEGRMNEYNAYARSAPMTPKRAM